MKKLAVIDLGTNVIKVLVGGISKTKYTMLYKHKITADIGSELLITSYIAPEVKKNIINILISIKKRLETDGVHYIVAKATSLFREAPNATEVIEEIRLATNFEVHIISSLEEANLIYLGTSSVFTLTDEYGLIIDIGGGSVECIIFNAAQQLWAKSFKLGIRRIGSRFAYSPPLSADQVHELEAYYETALLPFFAAAKQFTLTRMIGSSGAFRTLLLLYESLYPSAKREIRNGMPILGMQEFLKIYKIIVTRPSHIWQQNNCIEPPIFLKFIPLSVVLINLIMKTCNLQEIVITDHSFTTGIFIQEWKRLKNKYI